MSAAIKARNRLLGLKPIYIGYFYRAVALEKIDQRTPRSEFSPSGFLGNNARQSNWLSTTSEDFVSIYEQNRCL